VPSFVESGSVALLNLRTLEVAPMQFGTQL
jgi:hypothetical protein